MALADERMTSRETDSPSSRSRLRLVSCSMALLPMAGQVVAVAGRHQTRPPAASIAAVIAAAAASGSSADADGRCHADGVGPRLDDRRDVVQVDAADGDQGRITGDALGFAYYAPVPWGLRATPLLVVA